jgi:site-specific recombinase XerD
VQAELDQAAAFARAEKAESTRRAYRSDFDIFTSWAAERGVASLPAAPETVAAFLARQATGGAKPSTIARRVAAIRYAHRLAGYPAPTEAEAVKATVRGIRRARGVSPRKMAPATSDRLIAMAAAGDSSVTAKRDRALLLLGFAGAFRRSELVALDVSDLREVDAGLLVTIRGSKTDQERVGQTIAIPRGSIACPVAAVREWLDAAGIAEGAIFRPVTKAGTVRDRRLTPHSVAAIVKARAARVGLKAEDFGGHSLRAGFLTSAAAKGASLFKMMDVSRHKSVDTLRGYVRSVDAFKDHAGAGLL